MSNPLAHDDIESCPCEICVWKTIAAKMAYIHLKLDPANTAAPQQWLEVQAAHLLGAAYAEEVNHRR